MPRTETAKSERLVYSPTARAFHWAVAALVIITAPIGFIMADRGERNIWDATTNNMYATHKAIGVVILLLMAARLTYRLMHGAPRFEPTLTSLQKGVSHAVHWTMYALLIMVPIGGYYGIAKYPALDVFGVKLPSFGITPDEKFAEQVFKLHGFAATVLLALVALHLAAAFHHTFVKGDGVLARMWPGAAGKD